MNTKSIYIRLQNQYTKLNSRIQKSIKTGKFYQFTQFKQKQLLARLKRYSLQIKNVQWNLGMKQVLSPIPNSLKNLGIGLAVVGTLGVATPTTAQYVPPAFMEHEGASCPIDSVAALSLTTGSSPLHLNSLTFVDIDGDGDQDLFTLGGVYYVNMHLEYHENTGTATNPIFSSTPSTSPIPLTANVNIPNFVDIDNDGDLDCFATTSDYYTNPAVVYFENQGTSTAPNFVQITTGSSPLDSFNIHLNDPVAGGYPVIFSADIDNDGDIDFWHSEHYGQVIKHTKYFENQGTANTPLLILQPYSSDPLTFSDSTKMGQIPRFFDFDKDGDLDIITRNGFNSQMNSGTPIYFENTGTASAPIFADTPNSNTPLDSLKNNNFTINTFNHLSRFDIVDLDGDGDWDVTGMNQMGFGGGQRPLLWRFYENLDTTIVSGVFSFKEDIAFTIYPNPTSGILSFEKAITGRLNLYNTVGQKILSKELENEQEVNLSQVENGLYILTIETATERIRKKVLIQK